MIDNSYYLYLFVIIIIIMNHSPHSLLSTSEFMHDFRVRAVSTLCSGMPAGGGFDSDSPMIPRFQDD